MNQLNRLTTKEYWTTTNPKFEFERRKDHAIEVLIKKYIPQTSCGECIEIGSFPGPFLAAFGDLGYTLNGIDFHPKNRDELPNWLQEQGFKVRDFQTIDFFEFTTDKKFDVVASFGFIEHFENYREVILRHAALVKDGGFLVITTPNFRGAIQRWLHSSFDRKNLKLHNLASMQPDVWAEILAANGYEIEFKGFFGGFLFWRSVEPMNLVKRKMLWVIERIIPRVKKLFPFDSPAFSGYCGVIARKAAAE